jgi:transcription factor CON7
MKRALSTPPVIEFRFATSVAAFFWLSQDVPATRLGSYVMHNFTRLYHWGNADANTFTEFKEIRKEWKARKKEEEGARKAEEDRQRQAVAQAQQADGQPADGQHVQGQSYQQNGGRPSLPPIGYQQPEGHAQGQYAQQPAAMVYPQQNGQMPGYANYPNSPYAQQGQVYQQRQY